MSVEKRIGFDSVPLPAEVAVALRQVKPAQARNFEYWQAQSRLSFAGKRVPGKEVLEVGTGLTMIGNLLWVHEKGKWQCWKDFGMIDGWLLVKTLPQHAIGKPGGSWASRLTDRIYNPCHRFDSVSALEAREDALRTRGLKLTAKYRQAYAKKLARAEAKQAPATPKKPAPRP